MLAILRSSGGNGENMSMHVQLHIQDSKMIMIYDRAARAIFVATDAGRHLRTGLQLAPYDVKLVLATNSKTVALQNYDVQIGASRLLSQGLPVIS